MIWLIALKEFLNNIVSPRFVLGFLLCLFLVPFSMAVSLKDYQAQADSYEAALKEAEGSLQVRVYSVLRPVAVRPPEPMSIFCRGLGAQTGNKVQILLGEKPMLADNGVAQSGNPLLGYFFSLDFQTVLALVLSLLALLFTYDAVSGEREQGTLKLFLSNPVSRAVLLLGKTLGVVLTLLPILVFCFLLSWLIIALTPQVPFTADLAVRSGLLLGANVVFFLLLAMLGLLVSSRFRSSGGALALCLLVWVATVFLVPATAGYLARGLSHIPPREALSMTLKDLTSECSEKAYDYLNSLPATSGMNWNFNSNQIDEGMEMTGSPRDQIERYHRFLPYREPLRLEYAEKKWAHQQDYLDRLETQRRLAERLSLPSPSAILRRACSGLCRTDAAAYKRFLERTRSYREEFINYLKSKDLFSSYLYFTPQPPETFMDLDEIFRVRTGGEVNNAQEFVKWSQSHGGSWTILFKVGIPGTNFKDYKDLDLPDLPVFTLPQTGLAGSVREALDDLGLLAGAAVLLFFLAFVSFSRYDVR
jgi:ABC-type transport system involved in multi-copper enzyme maturation permease subunit